MKADHLRCGGLTQLLKLEGPFGVSLRVHKWDAGDPAEFEHSHPWSMTIFCLRGGYWDRGEGRPTDYVQAGDIRRRPPHWRHSVTYPEPGTITVVATGPKRRPWRYWIRGREVGTDEWNRRPC